MEPRLPDLPLEELDGSVAVLPPGPAALVFATQATADASAALARAVGQRILAHPGGHLWTVVSAPRMLKPMLAAMMKSVRAKGVDSARRHFAALGVPEPPDLEGRLRLLADWDSRLARALQVSGATVVLVNGERAIQGRWSGLPPGEVAEALAGRLEDR